MGGDEGTNGSKILALPKLAGPPPPLEEKGTLFGGNDHFLVKNYHFLVINDHSGGPSVHCGQIPRPPFWQCWDFGNIWTPILLPKTYSPSEKGVVIDGTTPFIVRRKFDTVPFTYNMEGMAERGTLQLVRTHGTWFRCFTSHQAHPKESNWKQVIPLSSSLG